MSDDRRGYVVGLVNQINSILGGEDNAEACTALTLSVACSIVATAKDKKDRASQARAFAKQLEEFVTRDDMADWIKHGTMFVPMSGRRNQ